jgi:DNA gyrase subunit A
LLKLIAKLRHILSSERTILAEVRREILEVREKYGDARRTKIIRKTKEFRIEDLIADEPMVVTVSNEGYIKRLPVTTYRKQKRGGRGITGMDTKEEDFVKDLFIANTHNYMLFFTNKGRVYWRKVHELPKASRTARGRAMANVLDLASDERVTVCLSVQDLNEPGKQVFFVTSKGIVKRTPLKDFSNPRSTGIRAIKLEADDVVIDVALTSGKDNILLATYQGQAIRFPETDVRSMGRTAGGVIGIRLAKDDRVVGMSVAGEDTTVLTVTENGFGKRTTVSEYRIQHRGGSGIINIKTTERNGRVVGMLTVADDDEVVLVATDGVVMRMGVKDLRKIGRNTQGVKLMVPSEGAKVSAVARAIPEAKEDRITEEADTGENGENGSEEEFEDDTD